MKGSGVSRNSLGGAAATHDDLTKKARRYGRAISRGYDTAARTPIEVNDLGVSFVFRPTKHENRIRVTHQLVGVFG